MSSVTWRYLAGDTSSFAVELALLADDAEDWMVDPDERASWGFFALWVGGVNVCEQTVQGETLHYAHWYLLPIVEWFVEQWDALLHEERLPAPNNGVNAARGFAAAVVVAELESASDDAGFGRADTVQAWYRRHGLRASAPNALLPDLFIRRYSDSVEFSTGSESIPGDDWGVVFPRQLHAVRIPVTEVAEALGDAIGQLAARLATRHRDRSRLQELRDQVDRLRNPSREAHRFAWLSGAGDRLAEFGKLWQAVHEAIPGPLREEAERFDARVPVSDGLALATSPATLLFGSLSPEVSSQDMVELYTKLLSLTGSSAVVEKLRQIGDEVVSSWDIAGFTPGEQGSLYGEQTWHSLGTPDADYVDVEDVLRQLDIQVGYVTLQDRNVRAVSMVGRDGGARIVVNRAFRAASNPAAERFTLAHELGHLLLDQDQAQRMIVASGPWAPTEVEQRANAFAAAFLIPLPLLHAALPADHYSGLESQQIRRTATILRVSFSALVSRLQNLGRIPAEQADALRQEGVDNAA